jgi:polygalacturonase
MPIVTCTVPQAQTVKGRAANEHRKDGFPGMKVMNVVTPSGRWTVHGTTNSQPLDVATASVSTMGVVRAASVVGQQRLRRNCNPPMRPQGNTAPDANGPLRSARTDLAGTRFHAHRDRSGSSAQANDPRRSTTPAAVHVADGKIAQSIGSATIRRRPTTALCSGVGEMHREAVRVRIVDLPAMSGTDGEPRRW